MVQAGDGGYFVAGGVGVSGSYAHGALLRVNAQGDTLWLRDYSHSDSTTVSFEHIVLTNDGHLIATGLVDLGLVDDFSNYDLYACKLDADGTPVWATHVGGHFKHWGYQVREAPNDGYICAGWGQAVSGPESDFYVVRLNASGDTIWTRSFGTPDDPQKAYAIQASSNNTWIVVGTTQPSATYIYAMRINDQGDTLWTQTISEFGPCYSEDLVVLPNDHVLIAGFSFPDGGCARPLLTELDEQGVLLWYQNYDHGVCEWAYSMCRTDSGYALFGNGADNTMWLTNVDSSGDTLWSRNFTIGTLASDGRSVLETTDSGFVMAGTAIFPGVGGADWQMFLIKTDTLGNVIASTHDLIIDQSVTVELYPNPVESVVTFRYATTRGGDYSLTLHDVEGRVVKTIVSKTHKPPGSYVVPIDFQGLAIGAYTLVLSAGERTVAVKALKN